MSQSAFESKHSMTHSGEDSVTRPPRWRCHPWKGERKKKKKGKYVLAVSATNDSGLVDFVKVLRGSIIRLVDESALAVGNARLTL